MTSLVGLPKSYKEVRIIKSTILVKRFDIMPSEPNYSELYDRMIIEREDDNIITTYYHRTNKAYNRVFRVPLNEVTLK